MPPADPPAPAAPALTAPVTYRLAHLCDTNILSELARREPNPGVVEWAEHVTLVGLSVISVEEILFGLSWKPRPRVLEWFEGFLASNCEVLPVTESIARRAGVLRATLAGKGQVRTQADMLLAATALAHDLTVVTRNQRDFEGCGVAVLNPFTT